jgi:hypothetical protein
MWAARYSAARMRVTPVGHWMADRRWVGLPLLALAAGCFDSTPAYPPLPGTLVGESAHFRLFVASDFDFRLVPAYLQGSAGLDALETDWADKQTMLKMPEGQRKIDYHLLTHEQITAGCTQDASGCELNETLQIATDTLPDQHELMHAYMTLVAPGANPVPFIVEGAAQAIGCEGLQVGVTLTDAAPPWEEAIMSNKYAYDHGGLFTRYLIRTQGVDAFVRYYQQAPGRRDPALFAANFSAFWHVSIDDAWVAMHTVDTGAATTDSEICPCSLPALPTDGQPIDGDLARHPYWLLPDTGNESLALVAPSGGGFFISDCAGLAPFFESGVSTLPTTDPSVPSLTDAAIAFVHFPSDGRRRFLTTVTSAPITSASVGPYITDNCDTPVPYQLPQDFVSGSGELSIIVDQTSVGSVSKYVQVQVPDTGVANLGPAVNACDSCAFGQGACVSTSEAGSLPYLKVAAGPLHLEWRLPPIGQGGFPRYFDGVWVQFTP